MGKRLVFYPFLDKDHIKKLNCQVKDLTAGYFIGNECFDLKCKQEDDSGVKYISILDDYGKWSPEKNNFIIKGVLGIQEIGTIFGEGGVAPENGKLGLGLVWKSKTSNYRGAKKMAEIDASMNEEMEIPFELTFDDSSLRGVIEISFHLFTISENKETDQIIPGLLVGNLESIVLILEGIDSVFTVFEKNAPGEVLWTVTCDWDDPDYDSFSECVRVIINTAHPAWQLTSEEDVRKELLKEIMASSIQIVLTELEQGQGNIFGDDFAPGSVSNAMSYFIQRAGIDMNNSISKAKTIREYLDKSMK